MATRGKKIDTVRSSRAGHTFHERWAARRALQLIFPKDRLFAIAVEGLSSTETATPGDEAEDVADLVLYYGSGDNFSSCERLETLQFKYKVGDTPVTASYLTKTIEKFADSLVGYGKDFPVEEVDAKLSFCFITNAEFSNTLWQAIEALKTRGVPPEDGDAAGQYRYLKARCADHGVDDPARLFARTEFRAGEKNLPAQNNILKRTLTDWSAGADGPARIRLHGLQELVLRKAGLGGQRNNLVKREDVLDALDCEPEDLFPADTRFVDVGAVVERSQLSTVSELVKGSALPVFIHADGGVGKTVFVQSLAASLNQEFEVVVFDCFGGGSYRSEDQARHLPRVGLVQIANELASRGLCDPLLPGDSDRIGLAKAARKRFDQAARTVKEQSEKRGVLIILDAADNAQLEADNRKEESFPRLLLSSLNDVPIDGLKLVLTARTHRMAGVVGESKIQPFELGPFTDTEAALFLKDRRTNLSTVEFSTAIARSNRNARVLDYLVQTWDLNVLGNAAHTEITVEEIIAQRCGKIFADLRTTGWSDIEIREFFAAISLLPPPIPLDELANALGWSKPQVSSAASDLAPMLEVVPHGAIFRDEPTETYVRETYSGETDAQQAIAQRLQDSQSTSAYAAEALPHFLVVINDSDRAFALADCQDFPKSVQSDFGRRRLTLARLYAAFRLAVASDDLDRVLGLTMRLAHVAAANARGDEFIRRSPSLAVVLGDRDAYRRLFNDRSGWRGARNARLTIAHSFAGEMEEASIQGDRTVGWINWNSQQRKENEAHGRSGPDTSDFAAVMFENAVHGHYATVDKNLSRWNRRFASSAGDEVLELVWQFGRYSGKSLLNEIATFAATTDSASFELKISLLARPQKLTAAVLKPLARSAALASSNVDSSPEGLTYDGERKMESNVVQAALTALLHSSRQNSGRILAAIPDIRPSRYDYGERYGNSRIGLPVLGSCVKAWSLGQRISYHHLLPSELKISAEAKALSNSSELRSFLRRLMRPRQPAHSGSRVRQKPGRLFDDQDCRNISSGIELILALVRPIEAALFARHQISSECWVDFLAIWRTRLRPHAHRAAEDPSDLLCRTAGVELARLLLTHADEISEADAEPLLELIANNRFTIPQKTSILALMAERPALHDLAGRFACQITDHIGRDDYIEQRGESFAELATSLISMSIEEAREYYRQGLSQLDKMGSNDHDLIYSLLYYASKQRGGLVQPALAQRLLNLCQTISHDEPSKFGWTSFGRAAANSIGLSAVHKLLRWDDQDVADFSYGLPQLVCSLAKKGTLDARRAVFLLSICEDHGWHDWRVGDGLKDLLEAAEPAHRRPIFLTVLNKLKNDHPFGAWPSLWESLLEVTNTFAEVSTEEDRQALSLLIAEAKRERDEYNNRNKFHGSSYAKAMPKETNEDDIIKQLALECDPCSAVAIDTALRKIREDSSLQYSARSRFLDRLRGKCPYDKRLGFLLAVCEASELEFDDAVDLLIDCVEKWKASSAHLVANSRKIVEKLFEFKGSQLFDLRSSNITRYITKLSDFCSDPQFVLKGVLQTVALEQLDLNGDEWLQLATSVSEQASPYASKEALESLLSGPALDIADQVGEGAFRSDFIATDDQPRFLAEIIWHLLGDDDAYLRWNVARALKTLSDLGLDGDLKALVDGFDRTHVAALASPETQLSFQNSQQWLLMGLARVAFYSGQKLQYLRPVLASLAERDDVHVVNKLHIARCLENIGDKAIPDSDLEALWQAIKVPSCGYVASRDWPEPVKSQSGFRFDYEFDKSEVASLASLFRLSKGHATDAIAAEIKKRWPQATDLNYFPGRDRYRHESNGRYEFYREHIQRHALISAASTLVNEFPIVTHDYEDDDRDEWAEWLNGYDITFKDGTWLSDRKNEVPHCAKVSLLGAREDKQETLKSQEFLLDTLGLRGSDSLAPVPIYGNWISPDGVYVSFVSALSSRQGAVGQCERFARSESHNFWLPQFSDGGYFNERHRQSNPFDPFVWTPEYYGLGIDLGDRIAARGAAARPRLGIELTEMLDITSDLHSGEWRTRDGNPALRSQVWGNWEPDPDHARDYHHNNGQLLFADPQWLDWTLKRLGKRLVYSIRFSKYPSTREYDERSGVRAVFVGLRVEGSVLRVWSARKASKQDYW